MSHSLFRILAFALIPLFSASAAPLRVVAMHTVLAEFAQEMGGGEVELVCMVPAGSDPHVFNPAPSDVTMLAKADLVLATGLGLEPYFDKLIAQSGTRAVVFRAGAYFNPALGAPHRDVQTLPGEADPHWWHSPSLARKVAVALQAELTRLRPAASSAIDERAARLLRRLDALDAWARSEVSRIPSSRRLLITSHEAFGYLARDYGFQVHALLGLNPDSEPDARSLSQLITLIRREKIRVVFADNTENPKLFASMLRESGARLGSTLYADGLGPQGSLADTYERMFRYNLSAILGGLSSD
jgi:zinc/manganese transport system substrate-binding protein